MYKRFDLIFLILILGLTVSLIAGELQQSDQKLTTYEGELVCLSCDLKQAQGARAACKVYGHEDALKTADGKYIGFLENKYSADLLAGEKYHGKTVRVYGTYYADANLLDVERFEVDGQTKTWCDHCQLMDSCNSK